MGKMRLGTLATVAVATAFLTGCLTAKPLTDDEIKSSLAAGNGMVLVGYDMPEGLGAGFWGMDIQRIDPATGKPEKPNRDQDAPNAALLLDQPGADRKGEPPYMTFMLQPGEYAITSIGSRQPNGGPVYVPNFGAGGGGPAVGLIGLAVLAAMTAAAYAAQEAEDARFGEPGRPPLMYLYENQLVDETPRFTVRPGEVIYLGEILYGSTFFTMETTEVATGPNAADGAKVTRHNVASPFIEYLVDEPTARARLASMGLSAAPMRTVVVESLTDGPVYVSPRMTRERLEYRSNDPIVDEQVYRARADLPRPLPRPAT